MAFMPSQDRARNTAAAEEFVGPLEMSTGLRWQATIAESYAAAIEGLCAGQVDVAWLEPLAFVLAEQRQCATGILTALRKDESGRPNRTFNSQIIVRADSGIADLKGLKGKRFAFVDPLSTSGTLLPLLTIKQKLGEDPKTFFSQTVYMGTHQSSILALYQGQVDGAASFIDARDVLERTFPDIKQRTKRIETVGPIPNEAVAVRNGLPEDVRRQLTKGLIEHARSAEGRKALASLYGIEGLELSDGRLYDGVREAASVAGVDLEREARRTPPPLDSPRATPTRSP